MNGLFRSGFVLLGASTFVKISTSMMSGMMGMASDGYSDSITSKMTDALMGIVDFSWYFAIGIAIILFFLSSLDIIGSTGYSKKTTNNVNKTNNTSDTWKSKQLVIEQMKNDTVLKVENNEQNEMVSHENQEENKVLNVALMNDEEKIYYYLDLIHLEVVTEKAFVLLQKYHLLNEFLGEKTILIGLKDDNEKIISSYLPKILENHYKLQTSLSKSNKSSLVNFDMTINLLGQEEKKEEMNCHYTDDTMYQLDILEKSLDNMIDISQSNIEDEAKIMRLFLEGKFSSALPQELSAIDIHESNELEHKEKMASLSAQG